MREPGELFKEAGDRRQEAGEKRTSAFANRRRQDYGGQEATVDPPKRAVRCAPAREGGSPLLPMTPDERVVADYAGTGLTIGPHPVSFRRRELALRGVLRAIDLPRALNGRRVRVAGTVITRQRPGTAKGFVFLTLEDETGVANIIVRPDVFAADRVTILEQPFLLVEGVLQLQDGVTSVKGGAFSRVRLH